MKEIKNYKDYFATKKGYIISKKLNKVRKLKEKFDRNGYKQVTLSNEGKLKTISVHRLIAETFIPNDNNLSQVNHKNGIKSDNRVENLEWCNGSQNINHALKSGLLKPRKGEEVHLTKLTNEIVLNIRHDKKNLHMSNIELAEKYNTSRTNISHIINRLTWKHI